MSYLLGGRLRHLQPEGGHRSGIEPVLLAAAVPAHAGETVLEGGTGCGTALLCLAARVADVAGLGLEIDPVRNAAATANFAENGFSRLRSVSADLLAWQATERFDHAMANPPWHAPGTASPDVGRERARRAPPGVLARWISSLARPLRHHGTLSLVLAATVLPDAFAALQAAGCGGATLLPLWPRAGQPAKLVLLAARRGVRSPARVLPGLVLHEADGRFTGATQAILRDAAALPL